MTVKKRALCMFAGSVLALVAAACASQPSGNTTPRPAAASTQEQIAEQAREFRKDAYTLSQMAERREVEADVLARTLGEDDPRVQDKRRLARELRTAAEEADRQARNLRGTVPHGMVQ